MFPAITSRRQYEFRTGSVQIWDSSTDVVARIITTTRRERTAMTTTDISRALSDEQLDAITAKQQATWASGDYAVIGTSLQITGEELCESLDIEAGWHVLDVAAGNGNASLAAARRSA